MLHKPAGRANLGELQELVHEGLLLILRPGALQLLLLYLSLRVHDQSVAGGKAGSVALADPQDLVRKLCSRPGCQSGEGTGFSV